MATDKGTGCHWYDYISRKFVLALGTIVGGFTLAWNGKDTMGFAAIAGTALGFYSGANVMVEYFKSKQSNGAPSNG